MLLLSTSFAKNRLVTGSQTYHHANLRKTLLDAAVALIGEVGARAFTLREVARRAGVSHNAPYRHFASKDELLLAVAAEGFDRLTALMEKTLVAGKSPLERLELCGCGYVDFGLHWPNHLLVMFELPLVCGRRGKKEPAIVANAFAVLLNCIIAAQQSGDLPAGDPLPLAWTAWALVHGIAKLAISGSLPLNTRATMDFTHNAARAIFGGMTAEQSVSANR
jgi:AcrR family transcriptional regulator